MAARGNTVLKGVADRRAEIDRLLAQLPQTSEEGGRLELRVMVATRQDKHFMRTADAYLTQKDKNSPEAKMMAKLNELHAERLLLRELRIRTASEFCSPATSPPPSARSGSKNCPP
jgi:hypothetical protein